MSGLKTIRMGRPPVKQEEIADDLHRRIITNNLSPGSRLPTRRELCDQFGVSLMTVQSALDRLEQEGFIEAQGTRGSFVAQRPPHLHAYALVLPTDAYRENLKPFWSSLEQAARTVESRRGCEIKVWYGINSNLKSKAVIDLGELVARHRIAGLIFATPPFLLKETPIVQEPGIPRVALMPEDPLYPQVSKIFLDMNAFFVKAINYLRGLGRSRIALIAPGTASDIFMAHFHDAMANAGLEVRPYWVQNVFQGTSASARSLTHLLFRAGQVDRPDGLIIADDNLFPHAQMGLIDAGVRNQTDVAIVSHCNFPTPPQKLLPSRLLGFDMEDVIERCIDFLEFQRKTDNTSSPCAIAPRFDDEATARIAAHSLLESTFDQSHSMQ